MQRLEDRRAAPIPAAIFRRNAEVGIKPFARLPSAPRRDSFGSSVFIYQLEANLRYTPLTDPIFSWIERGDSNAVASTIAMTELLVIPIATRTNNGSMSSKVCFPRIQTWNGSPQAWR